MTTEELLRSLAAHLRNNGGVVLVWSNGHFSAASEWGQEAEDSPMIGAATYGMGDTLEECLNGLLHDVTGAEA